MKKEHYIKLENMMHLAPFVQLTGLKANITEGEAEIILPVERKLFHGANAMHGALYFLTLDNAAFFAVNSLVEDYYVLTATFDIKLTKPVSSGIVKAFGKVTKQVKSIYSAESSLYNSDDEIIAVGNGKFIKSKIKLSPELGYTLL